MKFQESKSIVFKLAVAFMISISIQCAVMSALLLGGGMIQQPKENEYKIFSEKVKSRSNNLENEMKNVWTNFEHYTKQISQYFSVQNIQHGLKHKDANKMLADIAPIMCDALLFTKTTGIFMILNDNVEDENVHSALYIRNADPHRYSLDNSNLSLMVGPWDVAQSTNINTNPNWSFKLTLDDEMREFYEKPFEQVNEASDSNFLGYWSEPFSINSSEEKVITYSIPLKDQSNNPIGVFGVEISLDYLYKFLPSTDLKAQDSYGYIIAREKESGIIEPIITRGALQNRMLELKEPLVFDEINKENAIYRLTNHYSEEQIVACTSKLGLYYNNTPFENEKWYLIGLMEKSELLQFSYKISKILILSVIISMGIGLWVAIFISRWFTSPIMNLSKQVKDSNFGALRVLKETGLREIDDLAEAIIDSQNRLVSLSGKMSGIFELTEVKIGAFEISAGSNTVFFTDQLPKLFNLKEEHYNIFENKALFKNYLREVMKTAEEKEDIFQLKNLDEPKWLRIKQIETGGDILGIVMDVTEDIIQTKSLQLERDSDALTGIRNRRAFIRILAFYNGCLSEHPSIGIGMFDMNGLKGVNDNWGHEMGDEYICESANAICAAFSHSPVFRIGGDEFAVILTNMNQEEIEGRNEKIIHKMNQYSQRYHIKLGIAFGYAIFDAATDTKLEDVMSRADANMYNNKNASKNL